MVIVMYLNIKNNLEDSMEKIIQEILKDNNIQIPNKIEPKAFLDDISNKNLIIYNGEI